MTPSQTMTRCLPHHRVDVLLVDVASVFCKHLRSVVASEVHHACQTIPVFSLQARWTCQAGAALNGVVLLIGGPLAAVANAINLRRQGRSLGQSAVAWAAFGQPLLTTVICGGQLLVNLRLLYFAGLGYVI